MIHSDKRRELAAIFAKNPGFTPGNESLIAGAFLAGYAASDARVQGLVEALSKIADPRKRGYQECMMSIADKALADWER